MWHVCTRCFVPRSKKKILVDDVYANSSAIPWARRGSWEWKPWRHRRYKRPGVTLASLVALKWILENSAITENSKSAGKKTRLDKLYFNELCNFGYNYKEGKFGNFCVWSSSAWVIIYRRIGLPWSPNGWGY